MCRSVVRRIAPAFVLAVLCAATQVTPAAQSGTFRRIRVTIVDDAGAPVRGARVQMRDARRADLVQTRTTAATGEIEPFSRRAGSEIEILPRLAGHFFEPPLSHVVVERDLSLTFVARSGIAPDIDSPDLQPWPEAPPKGAAAAGEVPPPRKGSAAAAGDPPEAQAASPEPMAVVTGQVLWAFTNPDGSVNDIALEGATLTFERTDIQVPPHELPTSVSDENGEFEPFEAPLGSTFDVTIDKPGYAFDPPRVTVAVDRPEVFLEFTGVTFQLGDPPRAEPDSQEPEAPPPAAGAPGAVDLPGRGSRDLQAPDLSLPGQRDGAMPQPAQPDRPGAAAGDGAPPMADDASDTPAVIAVQVTVRIPAPGGRIREIGADNARVSYRDLSAPAESSGFSGAAAPGGIAPPFPTFIGRQFEVTARQSGYRFPTERITVNLEETFVPIVGELDPDERCWLGGKIVDESGRHLRQFLRVSLYDVDGRYIQGRDATLRPTSDYVMTSLPPGPYILRVTPGRADVAFVVEPQERSVLCVGGGAPPQGRLDFTVR